MKRSILISVLVCVALVGSSCMWSLETSFFSNFSVRQLIEKHQSSAGLSCDAVGGGIAGGGGGFGHVGGLGSGGAHFSFSKRDTCGCRMNSTEAFSEAAFFSALKVDVERPFSTYFLFIETLVLEQQASSPANVS